MKKLIALTLMVVCLACCTLGCPGKKETPKSTTPPPDVTQPAGGDTTTEDAAEK